MARSPRSSSKNHGGPHHALPAKGEQDLGAASLPQSGNQALANLLGEWNAASDRVPREVVELVNDGTGVGEVVEVGAEYANLGVHGDS